MPGALVMNTSNFIPRFVLGHLEGTCLLTCRAKKLKPNCSDLHDTSLFYPFVDYQAPATFPMEAVLDLDEWLMVPSRVVSPYEFALAEADPCALNFILVEKIGEPEAILPTCARAAFYEVKKDLLIKLGKHLGYQEAKSSLTLYEILKLVVANVLNLTADHADQLQLYRILMKRLWKPSKPRDFFRSDKAIELLPKQEQIVVEREIVKNEGEEKEMEGFQQELCGLSMQVHPTCQRLLHMGKIDAERKGLLKAAIDKAYPRWAKLQYKEGDVEQSHAQALCPTGWRMTKDLVACRWQIVKVGTKLWRSQAFMEYTIPGAMRNCLRFAWRHTMEAAGFTLLDTPVHNLFQQRSGAAEKDAKQIDLDPGAYQGDALEQGASLRTLWCMELECLP
jgi:hypothetical protein